MTSPSDATAETPVTQFRPHEMLTPDQDDARRSFFSGPQRHSQAMGGARSLKTFLIVYCIIQRCLSAPGSRHAILRFRKNAVSASIVHDTLPKVLSLCFPKVVAKHNKQEGYFTINGTSEIWYGGLDDKERVDKILGQEYVTIFFNECSQIPYTSILVALTRLAQVITLINGELLRQRAYYDLNPIGKTHWSYQLFVLHVDPVSRKPLEDPQNYVARSFATKNNPFLTPEYLASLRALPLKQRKRFYDGEYQDETEGALWSLENLELHRVDLSEVPPLTRVVIGVDPSGAGSSEDTDNDMIGVVVAGLGIDRHAYVLADYTLHDSPGGWGRAVAGAFARHHGDKVVAEINYGGAMVTYVISVANPNIPVKVITSSRGKHLRAEPIAALYEDRPEDGKFCRVHHVAKDLPDGRDHLLELEDELCGFTATGYVGSRSPNRADAMVFALTELMLGDDASGFIEHLQSMAKAAKAGRAAPPVLPGRPKTDAASGQALPKEVTEYSVQATPYAVFAPAPGVRYTADGSGVIEKVLPEHLEALKAVGCRTIADEL